MSVVKDPSNKSGQRQQTDKDKPLSTGVANEEGKEERVLGAGQERETTDDPGPTDEGEPIPTPSSRPASCVSETSSELCFRG